MNTLGVLIPQSKAYPLIGKDFVNGLRLGLGQFVDIDLKIESIGLGADPEHLISTIQKMDFESDVDIITGLLGHYGFEQVAEFVTANEIPLIYSDLGATKPLMAKDYVYVNSLDLYGGTEAIGQYFSDQKIKNVVTSTCYYESGYGFIEALDSVFSQNESSGFTGHFITPLNPRENEAEIMRDWMEDINPDAIFAFHNGVFAKEHAEYLSVNEIYRKFPIYTLPFSADQKLQDEFPEIFEHMKCIANWFPELDNPVNQSFISDYKLKHSKTPSAFALLGYENGLLIQSLLQKTQTGTYPVNEQIKTLNVEGPRGELRFDPENNRTLFNHYIWKFIKLETGGLRKEIDQKLISPKYYLTQSSVKNNGWFNAYLCH